MPEPPPGFHSDAQSLLVSRSSTRLHIEGVRPILLHYPRVRCAVMVAGGEQVQQGEG